MLDRPTADTPPRPIDPSAIDAVVFDIGGVFTIRHHEAMRDALGPAGFDLPADPDVYHRAHYAGVRAMSDLLAEDGAVHEYHRSTWAHWERAYLACLGVPDHRMADALRAVRDLMTRRRIKDVWRQLLTDNIAAFHRIARSGMPVAVVSNNDGTAEEQLRHFEICQAGPGPLTSVTAVVDSQVVGVAKPDPTIFRPALDALGVAPARALYVGDTVHADVYGALAAGMPVVQLDPYGLHGDFAHARLPGVSPLADLLVDGR